MGLRAPLEAESVGWALAGLGWAPTRAVQIPMRTEGLDWVHGRATWDGVDVSSSRIGGSGGHEVDSRKKAQ